MNNLFSRHPYKIAGLSGLVAGGVFSYGLPALLLPILVLPLFLFFTSSQKHLSRKLCLRFTTVFFIMFYLTVLVWFADTDVTLLAGVDISYAQFFLVFCLIVMASVLTLASLPLGLVLYKMQDQLKQPSLWALLVIASTWVLVEWLRSLSFSMFLYAAEGTIGDYWNFGSLGLGFIATPFGYLSRVIGLYGLSALAVMFSIAMAWAIQKKYKPLLIITLFAALGSLASFTLLIPENKSLPISASVLQREGSIADLNAAYAPIKFKDDTPKELIVLNEYSNTHLATNEKFAQKYVENRLSATGNSIDVTADFSKTSERFGILEARDNSSNIVDTQTKQLLIPTGEYFPAILKLLFFASGQGKINDTFTLNRKLQRGEPPRVIKATKINIAPVACSGILGRNIYRQLVNDGGEVLTNSASLLIFSGSKAYFQQSLQMARFHAIANDRTYIQASMGAPAFVIDGNGNFIIAPEDVKTSFIDFSFFPSNYKTPYTRFGEWVLLVSALILVMFLGKELRSKLKHRRNS